MIRNLNSDIYNKRFTGTCSDSFKSFSLVQWLFKNKWTIVTLILIIGPVSFAGIYLSRDNDIESVEMAVVAKQPVVLYDGVAYQHDEESGWKTLDYAVNIKQVFTDEEYLCVLDVNGKPHCDELPDPYSLGMSGIAFYMAEQALAINEEEKFLLVNGHALDGVVALLSDGSLLYPVLDEHRSTEIEEEVAMLSGSFLLTTYGNVHRVLIDDLGVLELEPVYDGGDITYIDASDSASRCVGLTKDGKAMIWSDIASPDISDWNDLVKVVHGFNYVAGLTSKGKVVFKHYDEAKSPVLEASFEAWKDIYGIEAYFSSVYGVDKNGEVFVIDFS